MINNDEVFTRWVDTAAPGSDEVLITAWLWNITNIPDVMAGKPVQVEQVGPYVFNSYAKNFNVSFFKDDSGRGLVQFMQWSWLKFRPDLSAAGYETNVVCWPNEAFQGLLATGISIALELYLKVNESERLIHCGTPEKFLMGYIDDVIKPLPPDHGVVPGVMGNQTLEEAIAAGWQQIFTGEDDSSQLNQYHMFNGRDVLECSVSRVSTEMGPCWGDDNANALRGTDGTAFAPFKTIATAEDTTVTTFVSDTMRMVPLVNLDSKTNIVKGITLTRFELDVPWIMANASTNPDNVPYYASDPLHTHYYPNGFWNISTVQGAPILISAPHMLSVDPRVFNLIEGQTPDYEKHTTHLDVEPTTGKTFYARKRWQINMHVKPVQNITVLGKPINWFKNIDEWLILPMVWIEESGEITDDEATTFRSSVYLVRNLELAFKFGGGGLGLLLAGLAIFQFYMALTMLETQFSYKQINDGSGNDLAARLREKPGHSFEHDDGYD